MKIRVYYEDTDCGNVVYYANYLKYMERGRTEFMRDRGAGFARFHEQGLLFVVTQATLRYHAPAVYDDLLDVDTRIKELSSVSIVFETAIKNDKGPLLVAGEVRVACVNKEGKLRRIPREVLDCLEKP
jgi:acyl-CoA thioester hydrolase